jgi:cytochrome P450
VRKGDLYKALRNDINVDNTLRVVDAASHTRKKKLLAYGFTDKAMNSVERFIVQHVDRWCELLIADEKREEPMDMGNLADQLVFDVLCELFFGKSFDIKEPGENQLKSVPKTMDNYMFFMYNVSSSPLSAVTFLALQFTKSGKLTLSPFLSSWLWLKEHGLNGLLEKYTPADMRLYVSLLFENMLERIKDEASSDPLRSGRVDIIYYLYHTNNNKTGELAYSNDELTFEAGMLLNSVSRTTASVMAAFFFNITQNKKYLQQTHPRNPDGFFVSR